MTLLTQKINLSLFALIIMVLLSGTSDAQDMMIIHETDLKKFEPAKAKNFLSCKGKRYYYSKVDGKKGCYTCPYKMKRTSPTRKMDHPKACVNRKGKNTYAPAKPAGKIVKSCGKNGLGYKGRCYYCPKNSKPKKVKVKIQPKKIGDVIKRFKTKIICTPVPKNKGAK